MTPFKLPNWIVGRIEGGSLLIYLNCGEMGWEIGIEKYIGIKVN